MKLPDAVYKLPSKKVTLICTHFKNNFVFKFFNTCVCVCVCARLCDLCAPHSFSAHEGQKRVMDSLKP